MILLAACNGTPPKKNGEEAPAAKDLTVRGVYVGDAAPVEGELGVFEIRVINATRLFAVLRDLILPGGKKAWIDWQVSQEGTLAFAAAADAWTWDRKTPGLERPVFNRGLLGPGEEIVIRTRLRLLDLPRRFALRYFAFRREDIGQFVYFEKRVDREIRYVRMLGRDLEKALARSDTKGAMSHRTVIFPHAEQVDALPLVVPVDLGVDLIARPFTREKALAKAGVTVADEVSYCSALDAWALRAGERCWLVSAKEALELPAIARLEPFFHLVDGNPHPKLEIEFLKQTGSYFVRDFALVHDREKNRVLLFLPKSELRGFFEKVRGAARLEAVLNPDGTGRILVTR